MHRRRRTVQNDLIQKKLDAIEKLKNPEQLSREEYREAVLLWLTCGNDEELDNDILKGDECIAKDTISPELMEELKKIKAAVKPTEILLTVDAMLGQDAVNVAQSFNDLLDITTYAVEHMEMKTDIMSNPLYMPAFSVEEVNARVSQGVPFRDAYRQVADEITHGTFQHHASIEETLSHYTHEGSIGNLGNEQIKSKMSALLQSLPFSHIEQSKQQLLGH